jgi:predicted nucleotide-binding protein
VFVVHGRNDALRTDLFGLLRTFDLHPLEWSELVRDFGKGVPYIGQLLDRAFEIAQAVVVLMSPDERVELLDEHNEGAPDAGFQARPNVIFEAGMALGRSPDRTVIVEVGPVRPFSDLAGRHMVRLNDRPDSKDMKGRQDLGRRLEALGCPVQMGGSDWHSFGVFVATPRES